MVAGEDMSELLNLSSSVVIVVVNAYRDIFLRLVLTDSSVKGDLSSH